MAGGLAPGRRIETTLSFILCLFVLVEVNYPRLSPQSQLVGFGCLGLLLCFLNSPSAFPVAGRVLDGVLMVLTVLCAAYMVVQTESGFASWWVSGDSLGNRAGQETRIDLIVGSIGLILVLEGTRRSLGWALPSLSLVFLVYCFAGPYLPGWLLPHRGYTLDRVVSQVFLHSQGVFGIALRVMFTYVFLFVLFGALLELAGVPAFVLGLSRRVFAGTSGGPGKISVVASGLMGSLSGSAVANAATTGTFTIPLMRSAGFESSVAAAMVAAASSGGALMPPVMGAAAYMMLEIVSPPVTYLEVIRAALIPALLYYFSLLLLVHLYSRRHALVARPLEDSAVEPLPAWAGVIFVAALALLLALLAAGYTPFRAVTLAAGGTVVLSWFSRSSRLSPSHLIRACRKSGRAGAPLICAAACVGVIIGVVTLTGLGTRLPSLILPLAQDNLVGALFLIMVCSLVLGMGLPSAVCYLLLATFIGSILGDLHIVPLAGHLFIFYFGMMSMVTPPVALAAYTTATIAESPILATSWKAFCFSLVGFTLPYMFVLQPQLLLLNNDGSPTTLLAALPAISTAVLGITSLAGGLSGFLGGSLSRLQRFLLFVSAALLLYPSDVMKSLAEFLPNLAGCVLLGWCFWRSRRSIRG